MKRFFKIIVNLKRKIADMLPEKGSKNENLFIKFMSFIGIILFIFILKRCE
jgi:hypothetical protein